MRHAGKHTALILSERTWMSENIHAELQNVVGQDAIAKVVIVPESTNAGQAKCLIA